MTGPENRQNQPEDQASVTLDELTKAGLIAGPLELLHQLCVVQHPFSRSISSAARGVGLALALAASQRVVEEETDTEKDADQAERPELVVKIPLGEKHRHGGS